MRLLLVVFSAFLFLVSVFAKGSEPFSLSGTVTNTTNLSKPVSGAVTISFDSQGECVLRVGSPLYGSGSCSVEAFSGGERTLTVHSSGPSADIIFKGKVGDTGFQGAYEVNYPNFPELPQHGNFSLTFDATPVLLQLRDVLTRSDFAMDGKDFHVFVDRDLAVFLDKDFTYLGTRVFLDSQQNPILRIEDHKNGSLYIDPSTNKTLMEWHTDGKDGYFSKTTGGLTIYYDRFMNYLDLSSVDLSGQRVYAYERSESIELYDASFKPLNIRSGKTSSGKIYWMRTDSDGVTEYFDDSMKPLQWYSAVRDGQTYYANVVGKNVRVYDSNLHPVHRKSGFLSAMARGLVLGLAAYGQALQAQARAAGETPAYVPSTTTYNSTEQRIGGFGYTNTIGSDGSSYHTTTQTIGNFDYSATTGPGGYFASTTRQQIGNFGYINGLSTNGSLSGTQQRIGNFDYSRYTTPAGSWTGTSQQIGNFTYHTFSAPDGSVHMGTSQRIGDFIYTSIR